MSRLVPGSEMSRFFVFWPFDSNVTLSSHATLKQRWTWRLPCSSCTSIIECTSINWEGYVSPCGTTSRGASHCWSNCIKRLRTSRLNRRLLRKWGGAEEGRGLLWTHHPSMSLYPCFKLYFALWSSSWDAFTFESLSLICRFVQYRGHGVTLYPSGYRTPRAW